MFAHRVAPTNVNSTPPPLDVAPIGGELEASNQIKCKCDVVDKEDCAKIVHELVAETAHYASLVSVLGSTADGWMLRTELQRRWTRSLTLMQQTQLSILPHLRGTNRIANENLADFEKLWNEFSTCVELLLHYLDRTLHLVRRFPLTTGTASNERLSHETPLINTGLSRFAGFPPSQEGIDIRWVTGASDATAQKPITSQQQQQQSTVVGDIDYTDAHCRLLEREIENGQTILRDIHDKVDIKPWAIEPYSNPIKNPGNERRLLAGQSSAVVNTLSVFEVRLRHLNDALVT